MKKHQDTRRTHRVSQLVQSELAVVIRDGTVRGPRAVRERLRSMIQVIEVDVAPDLANANVKVSVIGDRKDKISAIRWLQGNSQGLRHELAQRLQHMRRVPKLRFSHVDVGRAVDVMATIERLADERERKASGGGGDFEDGLDFDVSDDDAFDDEGDWDDDEDGEAAYDNGNADDDIPLMWRGDEDVEELFQNSQP